MNRIRIARTTYLAYLLVLLALALLGMFVAAAAHGSPWAPVLGIGMLAALGLSVLGSRAGGTQLALASKAAGHRLSVWVDPLQSDQIARYRAAYRGEGAAADASCPRAGSLVHRRTDHAPRSAVDRRHALHTVHAPALVPVALGKRVDQIGLAQ